jgi:hypothetical protein
MDQSQAVDDRSGTDSVALDETDPVATKADPAPADRPWRRALRHGTVLFLVNKVGLAAITVFASIGNQSPGKSPGGLLLSWGQQWDSGWFMEIAAHGYPPSPDGRHAAFFPLYPALARATDIVLPGSVWWAGLLVSNAALLAALVLIYRLAEHEFDASVAGRTTFLLLAYPLAFFFTAAYNESLFIALTVGCFYAMRRGHWWLAGALGGLAAATRSVGILLALAFAFEYLRQHDWRRVRPTALAGLLIPAGIGAVMAVDTYYYSDPLAFSHAQAYWGRELTWPWVPVIDAARHVNPFNRGVSLFGDFWIHNALELGTVLMMLTLMVLAVVGPWKLRRDQLVYPLYGTTLVLFVISFPSYFITYPLISASRYVMEAFPAFLMLGVLTRNPTLERLVLTVFLPLQGILIVHFLHGRWVA